MADDDTFKVVPDTYSKHFAENKLFKFICCQILLQVVQSNGNQDKLINYYHTNSNHRGIQEMLEHLTREHYFPNMKSKIMRRLTHCNICQTLKCDEDQSS